jgi:2-polyprenyl-6-methoxyphenol hydroxylase-like FAD-dependent oxidoreductase
MPDANRKLYEVMIVGAGPTGLVLALSLARLGVRVRIVDKAAEPGTTSRALAVQSRTLELYRPLGLADAVVAAGLPMSAINLWIAGRHVKRVAIGAIGAGLTPYPAPIVYPQDEHERLLIEHLRAAGVEVERPVEATGFEEVAGGVRVHLSGPRGDETCEAAWLAGCDGARSVVREALHAGFPGGTYQHLFYVADVEATGPVMNRELNVALDAADLLAVFALKGEGRARLIGIVREEAAQKREPRWEDVSGRILERLKIDVKRVNWFSTYHVHHRVAHFFRAGRAFLAGDAAHIHSPVGGQGMNTGIGDAVNLAWKLAAVLRGAAREDLLDTYAVERMAFAQRLVASTDRAFTFITHDGSLARFVRLRVVPVLFPAAFASARWRRFFFRTISQVNVNYRMEPFNIGVAGRVRGGDRLPWVPPAADGAPDNFAPLDAFDWQVHVYGTASDALAAFCRERSIALHAFAWREAMHDAGLALHAAYLVRPDGYVALADATANPATIAAYLDARGLRPFARAASMPDTRRVPRGMTPTE